MAFTNAWTNLVPAGGDAASTADDQIRRLRLDIKERMDQIVGDFSLDPVFTLVGRKRRHYWPAGHNVYSTQAFESDATLSAVTPSAIGQALDWSMPFPSDFDGVIVTGISIACYRDAGAIVSIEPYSILDDGSTASLGGGAASAVVGAHVLAVGAAAFPFTIDQSLKSYELRVHMVANGALKTSCRLIHAIWVYTLPSVARSQ